MEFEETVTVKIKKSVSTEGRSSDTLVGSKPDLMRLIERLKAQGGKDNGTQRKHDG